jgi:cytochrome c5
MLLSSKALSAALLAFAACIAPQAAEAQRSGKEVVEATCVTCHGTGVNGAPKIGDRSAWSKRASQGLTSLTQNALKGIRQMPSHGGKLDLTDLEIGRAVAYMVNQSGGRWTEPASLRDLAAERSGAQVVQAQCSKCHQAGTGGAPRIGDREAWTPRLKDGLDNAIRAAIRGHGGMPPRGDKADLTDAEVRNAVLYMINPAPQGKGAPAAAARAASAYKSVDGMEVHVGFVPAETLRVFPEGSPERGLHGGVPGGAGYYHVNVSLLDAASKAPIGGAKVEIRVAAAGMSAESKTLKAFTINNAPSYGNYVRMRGKTAYVVTVQVRKPGVSQPLEARFEHRTY